MEYLDLAGVLLVALGAVAISLLRRRRKRKGGNLVRRLREENGHA